MFSVFNPAWETPLENSWRRLGGLLRSVYTSRFPPRPLAGQRLEAAGQQLEAGTAPLQGSWKLLGGSKSLPWRAPGSALEAPGAVLEAVGDPWRHLGRPGGRPGGVLGVLEAVSEVSWRRLGILEASTALTEGFGRLFAESLSFTFFSIVFFDLIFFVKSLV